MKMSQKIKTYQDMKTNSKTKMTSRMRTTLKMKKILTMKIALKLKMTPWFFSKFVNWNCECNKGQSWINEIVQQQRDQLILTELRIMQLLLLLSCKELKSLKVFTVSPYSPISLAHNFPYLHSPIFYDMNSSENYLNFFFPYCHYFP